MSAIKDLLYLPLSLALRTLAKWLLARHQPRIIAITGSVGKTSTKRAVAAVVEGQYRTQWHDGNYNSEIGLPLALFELHAPDTTLNPLPWIKNLGLAVWKLAFWQYPYELLVLELGIGSSRTEAMDTFSKYISAEVGIITAIQEAHLEGFGSLDAVYHEKTKLQNFSQRLLVNGDDELLASRIRDEPGVSSYGFGSGNTITAEPPAINERGVMTLVIDGHTINSQLTGRHLALPLLAAWAIGEMFDIAPQERVRKLEELRPFPGRMNLLNGKRGSLIVDDSYNAVTPRAVMAAVDTVKQMPSTRTIAVIGNMNELGERSEQLHRELGEYLAGQQLDMIITLGDKAEQFTAAAAIDGGQAAESIKSFRSPYQAGNYLAPLLKKGDLVLVKGSQNGVFAEEVTALLLKNDADRSQLVRQDAHYLAIKHRQFDDA